MPNMNAFYGECGDQISMIVKFADHKTSLATIYWMKMTLICAR